MLDASELNFSTADLISVSHVGGSMPQFSVSHADRVQAQSTVGSLERSEEKSL
jgi:hypothetical protein